MGGALAERPAALGGVPGALPGLSAIPDGNYVWGGPVPPGQPPGPVQKVLIDEMKRENWHGMVRVDNVFYSVVPENSVPSPGASPDGQPGGTTTQCITKLGLRQAGQFGSNYERMGLEVMTQICSTYDNVEQFVKLNYASMREDARAGPRVQYRELLDSAQTVDILVKQHAEAGRSQEDLKKDDIFEIHMSKIACMITRAERVITAEPNMSLAEAQGCYPSNWLRKPPTSPTPARNFRIVSEEARPRGTRKGRAEPGRLAITAGSWVTSRRTARRRKRISRPGSSRRSRRGKADRGRCERSSS